MQYLKPLLSLDYWFNLNPAPFVTPALIGVGISIAVVLVAGIVVKWFSHRARKNPPMHRVLSRVGRALLTLAFADILLYFFSYEQVYLVSARFWWVAVKIGILVWAVFIIIDIVKNYPREKAARAERLKREKYLPRS